ncbi:MAG: hypothetical protein ABTR92_04590, partial [Candidatus Accumulibacter phosphatis]
QAVDYARGFFENVKHGLKSRYLLISTRSGGERIGPNRREWAILDGSWKSPPVSRVLLAFLCDDRHAF